MAVSREYLHPEFGWLCPSTGLRRKARLVLAPLAVLAILGALALSGGRAPQSEGALLVARGEEPLSEPAQAKADSAPPAIATMTADQPRPFERFRIACEGDPWSYIDGSCKQGKARRRPGTLAANRNASVSRLPLGRSSRPVIASSEAHAGAAPADPTAEPVTLSMSVAPAPRAPTHPKVHKPPPSRSRDRDFASNPSWRGDPWSAQAYASPGNRNPGDRNTWSWGSSWSPAPATQPTKRK